MEEGNGDQNDNGDVKQSGLQANRIRKMKMKQQGIIECDVELENVEAAVKIL